MLFTHICSTGQKHADAVNKLPQKLSLILLGVPAIEEIGLTVPDTSDY